MVMQRKSIWWNAAFLSAILNCPAWAGSAHSHPAIVWLSATNYQLPDQTPIVVAPSSSPAPEYGALAELQTTAAMAIAVANRTTVIPGPDLSYRAGARGPLVEIAALGGGMDSAPALAHVGLDWIF